VRNEQNPYLEAEPGTPNPIYSRSVTRTYVRVVVLEAAIIVVLWFLGRMFS